MDQQQFSSPDPGKDVRDDPSDEEAPAERADWSPQWDDAVPESRLSLFLVPAGLFVVTAFTPLWAAA